jgi:hypothetical protein
VSRKCTENGRFGQQNSVKYKNKKAGDGREDSEYVMICRLDRKRTPSIHIHIIVPLLICLPRVRHTCLMTLLARACVNSCSVKRYVFVFCLLFLAGRGRDNNKAKGKPISRHWSSTNESARTLVDSPARHFWSPLDGVPRKVVHSFVFKYTIFVKTGLERWIERL